MWRAGRTAQCRGWGRAAVVAAALTLTVGAAGACTAMDGQSATIEVQSAGVLTTTTAVVAPSTTESTVAPTSAPPPGTELAPPVSEVPSTTVAPPTTLAPPPSVTAPPTTLPPPPPEVAPFMVTAASERDLAIAETLSGLGTGPARDTAAAALLQIRYDWIAELPGWQVHFREGRAGVRGLTFPAERVIEVYVRPSDTPALLAHVLTHELGHAVDVSFLNAASRAGWLQARSLSPATPWWVSDGVSDFASGSGDFAESFAWAFGPGQRWSGELAAPPTPLQVGLLTLLANAG